MDEIKELVTALAGLPNLTVWLLAGFLAYKLAVVGSIYGVLRLAITLPYRWKTTPAAPPPPAETTLGGRPISPEVHSGLLNQLGRLRSAGGGISTQATSRNCAWP